VASRPGALSGATDITFIHAENQRLGGELAGPSKAAALEMISQVAAQCPRRASAWTAEAALPT